MVNTQVKYFTALAVFILTLATIGCQPEKQQLPALIPLPQQIEWNGQKFNLADSSTRLVQRLVPHIAGVVLNHHEAYTLEVTNDSLILLAITPTGLYRGLQTVRQLTAVEKGKRMVDGCSITDWPAFRIRGFMQDVGRNFQPMDMLKEQIDVLAIYKMNVFHFHVTEDPGWRLESKLYPQLNEPATMSRWPGNYYTQDDFMELVAYCNERHITLIPEFDVPGHSTAFRKALGFDNMTDARVQPVLIDLIDELCSLASADIMPYIHIGTDEVWHSYEGPSPTLLPALVDRITNHHGREVIVWRPGQAITGDSVSITQLWSSGGQPKPGHRYLDSRLNYLNHLDPLSGIPQLYFERINDAPHGDSLRMGGILCNWNDNLVTNEYDAILHNPVYPGILTYSETSWTGQYIDFGEEYLAKFPSKDDEAFAKYLDFEERLIRHRDLYFNDKPFPYVKQTGMEWSIAGPFNHNGDLNSSFPLEESIKTEYIIDSESFAWSYPIIGGTVHLTHFFGYPSYFPKQEGTYYAYTRIWSPKKQTLDAWISFHDWSRSGGRRGGPFPEQGQWHNTNPKVWVNGEAIEPPVWKKPGVEVRSDEIPFSDENYFFREPSKINLEKGWNEVLLKIPVQERTWKRMFTFVPVDISAGNAREVEGLRFSAQIDKK
jgi:hypothetical protein